MGITHTDTDTRTRPLSQNRKVQKKNFDCRHLSQIWVSQEHADTNIPRSFLDNLPTQTDVYINLHLSACTVFIIAHVCTYIYIYVYIYRYTYD